MSTQPMVPMLFTDGSAGNIPVDQVERALADGHQRAAAVIFKDGTHAYIPLSRFNEAVSSGDAKPASSVPTQFEQERDQANQPGIIKTAIREGANFIGGMAQAANAQLSGDPYAAIRTGSQVAAQDTRRALDQRSPAYRVTAGVGSLAGVNASGMEDAADVGNWRGVLGTAAADAGAALAAKKVGELGARGVAAVADAPATARQWFENRNAASIKAAVPEAADLPAKAVLGTNELFKATAPVGSDSRALANHYTAAGDLAEIGNAVESKLQETKGGVMRPDLRVKATLDAVNDHLREMYEQERAPQIERNADAAVVPKFSQNAREGLAYLAENAGTPEVRAIAGTALGQEHMTVAELNDLAMNVNKELVPLKKMSASGQATEAATNRRINALEAIDAEAKDSLNRELINRGEGGVSKYETRYSALSAFRNQLQTRVNASVLNQPGVIKFAVKAAKGLAGGTSSIASASQAAVADVIAGKALQRGFQLLSDSGISAARDVGSGPRPIRGLLPAPDIQLPSSQAPLGSPSMPQQPMAGIRAQRLGLLLPERTSFDMPPTQTPIEPLSSPPRRIVVRDPKTGQMKIQYVVGGRR